MDNWHWPQYLIATMQIFGVVAKCVLSFRDRSLSSDRATLIALAWIAYVTAYSFVLHAGGFW